MNRRALSRTLTVAVAVLVLACVGVTGFRACHRAGAEVHRRYASPDGRFEIVVYRIPSRIAFPGQGSDAPGWFVLRDVQTGRVLRERNVEMVQLVDPPQWSPTNVNVTLLADWKLPR